MWETLYDSFWDKLVRFCRKLTRDEGQAEDLAQEAFLRAMGRAQLLAGLTAPQQKAWLFETAHNLYCDAVRRAAKERALLEKYAPPPGEDAPDEAACAALGGVELAAVLARLPDSDRILFAKLTGEPAATIRTRLHRIRKQLQQALKEE